MCEANGSIAELVMAECRALGFALAGVCDAAPSERAESLAAWLGAGRHGEMKWMEERLQARVDPRALLPGARSMILVADVYEARGERGEEISASTGRGRARGRIARYARGDDYHAVMKKRLHALCDRLRERFATEQFAAFVDTAPVLEREHAARAGLGWIGKHTLVIHPAIGSWFFLGGVLTTLPIEAPAAQRRVADHCGTCTRCIDACPTGAITPYSVDATKCISYLTIEHRSAIDPRLHEGMGEWIFGCDICQEVCPHNGAVKRGRVERSGDEAGANPAYAARREGFDLLEVLGWTEEDRRGAFQKSAMKRARLEMMKRNAIIAAGNSLRDGDEPALRSRIEEIADSRTETELVRETARQVLEALVRREAKDGRPSGGATPVPRRTDSRPRSS